MDSLDEGGAVGGRLHEISLGGSCFSNRTGDASRQPEETRIKETMCKGCTKSRFLKERPLLQRKLSRMWCPKIRLTAYTGVPPILFGRVSVLGQ